eukprot:SAG25_NODE_1740_length_2418_cov_2.828879_1_plen_83_part_00
MLRHKQLRAAFYRCFDGVKDPDHDVDTLHIFLFSYMWNADTNRRLEDAMEFYDCNKEKTQQTTRGKVSQQKDKKPVLTVQKQ